MTNVRQAPVLLRYDGTRLWENDLAGAIQFGLNDLAAILGTEGLEPIGKPSARLVYGAAGSIVLLVEVNTNSKGEI